MSEAVVADTSVLLALADLSDRHHQKALELWEGTGIHWRVPWAVLPEMDYLLRKYLGARVADRWIRDLRDATVRIEWGDPSDLDRAAAILERHKDLGLGLVDATVMAIAERLRARAIATLDLRHFSAVALAGAPALWPRDASA